MLEFSEEEGSIPIQDVPADIEVQSRSTDVSSGGDGTSDEVEDTKEEMLQKAYQAVRGGMSGYKAAKEFKISRTTLARLIKRGGSNPFETREETIYIY